jgi:signal transduction histidine kinase/ligand-binding sensor domain-containing protein
MLRYAIGLILWFGFILVKADTLTLKDKTLTMDAITIRDNLSQGMINSIAQDHWGFMWFGTVDGLNRYDGYRFTVFLHDANNPYSISSNLITCIFEDSHHRLWVGTGLNGLNLFQQSSERFIRFNTTSAPPYQLSDDKIISIQEDKFGNIWVATTYGLNKITIDNSSISDRLYNQPSDAGVQKIEHIKLGDVEEFVFQEETGRKDYFEPKCYIDHSGLIWVTTKNHIYNLTVQNSNSFQIKKFNLNLITNGREYGEMFTRVYNIAEDTVKKNLYFFQFKQITIYNYISGKVITISSPGTSANSYRSGYCWLNGKLWLVGLHIYEFDFQNNIVNAIKTRSADQYYLSNWPNTVFKDRAGTIWIGTKGYGILKYNPRIEAFNFVKSNSVLWMSTTPENNVIINNSKLFLMRNNTFSQSFETDTAWFYNLSKEVNMAYADFAVCDNQHSTWLSRSNLYQVDASGNTTKFDSISNFFPLFTDKNSNVYFGTNTAFNKISKSSGQIFTYPYPEMQTSGFTYKYLQAVHLDQQGVFWLGTTNGLFRFDEKHNQWKRYGNEPGNKNSLSENVIFSICPDPLYPDQFLWIGTKGGGLNFFDKKSERFVSFKAPKQIPNNVIYGILPDRNKNLWLSSNKGIFKLKPDYSSFSNLENHQEHVGDITAFDEQDGLQSNEFNRNAFAATGNGWLFFGGVNGYNYFKPEHIETTSYSKPVLITDIKINNQSLEFNLSEKNNHTTLSRPAFLTSEITIPYSASILTIEFAAMDFASVNKNHFSYRLLNFDDTWINTTDNHSATFTNLSPGTYTFQVISYEHHLTGQKMLKPVELKIIVMPPWYMTWWFRLSLLILIALGIYSFNRFRYTQKLELLKVRNRIATDLHDEIGSTLSGVYIYSEVAHKAVGNTIPEASSYLKSISADVSKMIEALSDIVWTVNSKNDRFENIINRMRAAAIELFEAKGYQLHLELDPKLNDLKLGMEGRKDFYLLFKEAINNVAKYAHGQNVWISIQYIKNKIVLTIKDDGVGFNPEKVSKGNGLNNYKTRASNLKGEIEIISSLGTGTTIQLTFPYSYI